MKTHWILCCILLLGMLDMRAAGNGSPPNQPPGKATPPPLHYDKSPLPQELRQRSSYAGVFRKVAPSVVTVFSTKKVKDEIPGAPFNDPLLRKFFGENNPHHPRERVEKGLGSGIIISDDGYILSNNHVVEGADTIKIRLHSGGPELPARVVGMDPPTDLAVLKVETKEKLTPIVIADSGMLSVGDTVLVIGNPFGVGQTVTQGIVSGTGRGGLGIVDYEDFIQTDASINPGNSGGALVDVLGRLVGVPTAILSRSGGNMGIGFATSSNLARSVLDRIITHGRVIRGYLGVFVQPVTPQLAREFKLRGSGGALVGGLADEGPGAKAGLLPGDVIMEVEKEKVTDARSLRMRIAQMEPGSKVHLRINREGKERTVTARLDELPTKPVIARSEISPTPPPPKVDILPGVELADLSDRARQQFEIPDPVQGVLIVSVEEFSKAAAVGLKPGDVLQEVNRQKLTAPADLESILRKAGQERLLLRVWGKDGSRFLVLESKLGAPDSAP